MVQPHVAIINATMLFCSQPSNELMDQSIIVLSHIVLRYADFYYLLLYSKYISVKYGSYGCSEIWKQWLQWLAPYVCIDPVLPYTFLALLSHKQFHSLLKSFEIAIANLLPINGLLACTEYHIENSKDPKVTWRMLLFCCNRNFYP